MPRFAIINNTLVENVILADTAPSIPGRIAVPLTVDEHVSPGDSYNGSVFTAYVPTAAEIERRDAPQQLRQALPLLKAWSTDNLSAAELTALSAAQRTQRQAQQEARVATLARLVLRLIWYTGQDDGE